MKRRLPGTPVIIIVEAVLATGAIDAVLSEFNCTLSASSPLRHAQYQTDMS